MVGVVATVTLVIIAVQVCEVSASSSAVSRKRREFGRFPTFQERQKTAFGLFLANSGISCISEGICI